MRPCASSATYHTLYEEGKLHSCRLGEWHQVSLRLGPGFEEHIWEKTCGCGNKSLSTEISKDRGDGSGGSGIFDQGHMAELGVASIRNYIKRGEDYNHQ